MIGKLITIRRVISYLPTMIFLLPMVGCSLLPQDQLYRDYAVQPLNYSDKTSPLNRIMTAVMREKMPDGKTPVVPESCVDDTAVSNTAKAACVRARQIVVGDLVALSDQMCAIHKQTIFGNEAAFNISTGTLTNAFSGAATVVGGAGVKAVLAAVAAFSNAERSLVNETVYKSILVPAVTKKIDESRQAKLGIIKENLKKGISDYSLSSAVFDVLEYHQDCSFMEGLQKALDEGTQDKSALDAAKLSQSITAVKLQMDQRLHELGQEMSCADDTCKNDAVCKAACDAFSKDSGSVSKKSAMESRLKDLGSYLKCSDETCSTDKVCALACGSYETLSNKQLDSVVGNNAK